MKRGGEGRVMGGRGLGKELTLFSLFYFSFISFTLLFLFVLFFPLFFYLLHHSKKPLPNRSERSKKRWKCNYWKANGLNIERD